MSEKRRLVAFPTSAIYSKAVYDKLEDFSGSYLMVCEVMGEDMEFKNLRRLVVAVEGSSLYSKLLNLR